MKRGRLVSSWFLLVAGTAIIFVFPFGETVAKTTGSPPSMPLKGPSLLEFNYADVRLSTPPQQLSQAGERLAGAQALFIQGLVLEDTSSLTDAMSVYTESLQLDPGGNPDLAVRVANEYAKEGDVATGINLLKDLAKARPNSTVAYLNLAFFYLNQLKKPDLALKYAEEAARVAPNDFQSYEALFQVNVAMKRKKEAELALQQAAKLNLSDANFWIVLIDLSVQLYSNPNGSFPANRVPQVEPFLQKAVSLAGNNADIYSKIADDYILLRQVRSAIPLYLKALELNKGNQDLRYKLAQSFVKTGQRQEAIQVLEEMVQANPMAPEAYEFLAKLYDDSGNLPNALINYQQALLLAPNEPQNYLHVADAQLRLKKFDEAINTLKEARRHYPVPQVTYSLAIALSSAKRFDDALPVYEAALQEAESSQPDVASASFYFNYGVTSEQAGLVDKAADLLKKCIDLDPVKAAPAYNYLGYMWVDRNVHVDEGGEMIKKALELDPDNGAYLDSLGWFYYRKGEFGKGLTELLRAVDHTKPEDPTVFEHVADTYRALGNVGQALTYWQKALTLDPQNHELQEKIGQAKPKPSANPSATPMPSPSPSPPQ